MPLPAFTESGDLPVDIHEASLDEAVARFGTGSDRRKTLAGWLECVYETAMKTGQLARFIIFGSFVTSKSEPNDVDVFMIMDDNFDMQSLQDESRLLFADHTTAQDRFGASVFWMRRFAAFGSEREAIADWQIKRDGTRRGIVEIVVNP